MPTAIIRRAILNIEGKAKATAAVPQPKPGVVKTYYKSQQNTRKFRMESEQKEEKRLAGFWHNLLLVRSLRRLRQDLVKLIHCLQAGGLGFESPHACADYSYACSMPKATNRGLMEANGPELGC